MKAEKTYRFGEGEVRALRGITFNLPPGELTVLVGPSGSGKTTLLNLLGGLDHVTAGRLIVDRQDLTNMDEAAMTRYRRGSIGFVFQFFNLVPTLTARENVEIVAELVSDPLDPMEALDAVGLSQRANHFPAALSGGEQQRVAVARALIKRPALLLADEPTGNLDYETGIRVLEAIRMALQRGARGVLLVTHNQEITRMADRMIHLRSGRIAEITVNPSPTPVAELRW